MEKDPNKNKVTKNKKEKNISPKKENNQKQSPKPKKFSSQIKSNPKNHLKQEEQISII